MNRILLCFLLIGAAFFSLATISLAETYSLRFAKSSSGATWNPSFPGWTYSIPVRFSGVADSTSQLRLSLAGNMSYKLDQRDGQNVWRENASVRASVNYPILGPKASIGVNGSMSVRNAALQKQKIRNQSYGFSFRYDPIEDGIFKSLSVNLTPGIITARRASRANLDSTIEERGIQYNASLRVSPSGEVAGQKMKSSFSMSKRDNTLKNNKDRNETLRMSWGYTLPKDVRTNVSVSESRSERGLTRSVITEQEIDGEAVRDTLVGAEIAKSRGTTLKTNLKFKAGRFDMTTGTTYTENSSQNTANAAEDLRNNYFGRNRESTRWRVDYRISGKIFEGLVGKTNLAYNKKDEGRLEVELADGSVFRDSTADRQDRDLVISGSLDWKLAKRHTLSLSGQARSVARDNPGARERDQDSFNRSSRIQYRGARNSGMNFTVSLTNTFSHRVNLHASRSSNNSRNRDIVLAVKTNYKRLGTNLSHGFGISARRTIFDFDRQINRNERDRESNIRRGWNMTHSLNRRIFENLRVNGRYSYIADDLGKLIVENSAQLVEQDNNDHKIAFGMTYSPSTILTTQINYSYRLDRQWDHTYVNLSEERVLAFRNEHQNLGASVTYRPSRATTLSMNGSRSRQRSGTFDSIGVKYTRTI